MTDFSPLWAFFGLFAGPWKLAAVAAVIALFYGPRLRSLAGRFARGEPPPRPEARSPARRALGDRLFLLLLVMAASAVATWIVVKMTISAGPSPR